MSDLTTPHGGPIATGADRAQTSPALPFANYLLSLGMVAVATLLAFVADNVIAAPNLSLLYVLPVVIAGTAFGWGPALTAALAGVLAFDFFFTKPYFSLVIYRPSDIWAAALLLVIAAIVTTLAAQARRRALEANLAAERVRTLQKLAHVVIEARPRSEVLQAAASALHEAFRAPAVIFMQENGALRGAARAGGPELTAADEEAARGAFSGRIHTRADSYPYDQARFEFWPVGTPADCRCVIGVDFARGEMERPAHPEPFVDIVAAYLATALGRRA